MDVLSIAKLEGVTPRQIQRYIAQGFQGHKLPATRNGRSFVIAESDYRLWRICCGFERAQPEPPRQVSQETTARNVPAADHAATAALFPPWPQCADPNGVPTNVPDPHSCTMPHPLAVEAHRAQQLREQQIRYRGYADDNE
jgi:hypothetical protein